MDRIWSERRPARVLALGSALAPYALMHPEVPAVRVIDRPDPEFSPDRRWAEPAGPFSMVRRWLQRRQARKAIAPGRRSQAQATAHLFATSALAERLRLLVPGEAGRIHHLPNGIDPAHFSLQHALPNPSPYNGRTILFGVPVDQPAAAEAAVGFARSVLPLVRASAPDVRFQVIGGDGSESLRPIAGQPGVVLLPAVGDSRPWLARAEAVVIPLPVSARRPVLEAMAMARAVVASSAAFDDIAPAQGQEGWVADDPADVAQALMTALDPGMGAEVGRAARARVQADFSWERMMDRLDGVLDSRPASAAASTSPMVHSRLGH